MRELFRSSNGGCIVAHYEKPVPEEAENSAALKAFADNGATVILLKAVNKSNVRSADCLIDGVVWEVKTNYTASVSAIDNALRSCNGQSKNLILNITSGISDELLQKGLKARIHRTNLEKIVIERHGTIERTYTRADILGK